MTNQIALIFAGAIVLATIIVGGRFTPVAVPNGSGPGFVLILDRFTGYTRACYVSGCHDLGEMR
jgi:hypothetical protein